MTNEILLECPSLIDNLQAKRKATEQLPKAAVPPAPAPAPLPAPAEIEVHIESRDDDSGSSSSSSSDTSSGSSYAGGIVVKIIDAAEEAAVPAAAGGVLQMPFAVRQRDAWCSSSGPWACFCLREARTQAALPFVHTYKLGTVASSSVVIYGERVATVASEY